MRYIRLTTLAIFASLALTACSSPTAADDDCTDPEVCLVGHPTTGS